MKTREELYSKEAAELLRVISAYKTLRTEQVYRLFPRKEQSIRLLVRHLLNQKRFYMDPEGIRLSASEASDEEPGTIKAFWVLLDFIGRVEYHTAGIFPVALSFFVDEELYEAVYIPQGQEPMICHALAGNEEHAPKCIVIIDDTGQINNIRIPGISGYCTVSDSGDIQYYQLRNEDA